MLFLVALPSLIGLTRLMFSFGFDVSEVADAALEDTSVTPPVDEQQPPQAAFQELPMSALRSSMPDRISYSPITIALHEDADGAPCVMHLARRDLFDVRFQSMYDEEEIDPVTREAVNAGKASDLIPGVYEGACRGAMSTERRWLQDMGVR